MTPFVERDGQTGVLRYPAKPEHFLCAEPALYDCGLCAVGLSLHGDGHYWAQVVFDSTVVWTGDVRRADAPADQQEQLAAEDAFWLAVRAGALACDALETNVAGDVLHIGSANAALFCGLPAPVIK
jgi:hypothetical protein